MRYDQTRIRALSCLRHLEEKLGSKTLRIFTSVEPSRLMFNVSMGFRFNLSTVSNLSHLLMSVSRLVAFYPPLISKGRVHGVVHNTGSYLWEYHSCGKDILSLCKDPFIINLKTMAGIVPILSVK